MHFQNTKGNGKMRCKICGSKFFSSRANQKYCSKVCREKARYARRKKDESWVRTVREYNQTRRKLTKAERELQPSLEQMPNPPSVVPIVTNKQPVLAVDKPYINLHFLGDFHLGNPHCDIKSLKKAKSYIKQDVEHNYVIGMGDFFELSTLRKPFSIFNQKPVKEQWDFLTEYFADMPNVAGLICGNHEKRTFTEVGIPLMQVFARELRTDCWGYRRVLTVHLTRDKLQSYYFDIRHGCTAARTAGGKLNAVKRSPIEGIDVVASGHTHDLNFRREPYRITTEDGVKWCVRYYIQTGGFLMYPGSYAEQKDLEPVPVGHAVATLHAKKKKLEVKCLGKDDYERD